MRRLLAALLLLPALHIGARADQSRNILNNGGFEYGLMCFQNWVWSVTGQDYKGDYRFGLSTDAHSGAYSLEIACQGEDCAKAAIFSNNIPTTGGESFRISLYTKCPAGRSALLYIPGLSGDDLGQWLTCNGDWALNEATFRTAADAKSFFFYIYNRDTTSLLIDDIVLTYVGGTGAQQTPQHTGTRNVALTGNALQLDGAPYLALGFFDVPAADLPVAAGTHANTLFALGQNAGPDCFCTRQKSYLDSVYEAGLNFVPDSSTTARLGRPEVFPAVAERFAPHLANIAWLLSDEPDQADVPFWYVPPATFTDEYRAAKTKTSLPILADFQRAAWSETKDVAPYTQSTDLWMAEPYGEDFSTVNHAIDMFASLKPKPVWLAQNPITAAKFVPKAYWAVIAGATGLVYFGWNEFRDNADLLAASTQAFGELTELKNVLFKRDITSLVTPPEGVRQTARLDDGTVYVLAASSGSQTIRGKFLVPGLEAGDTVTVLFENRTIKADPGGFTDTFDGVARHVYSIKNTITSSLVYPPPASTSVSSASYQGPSLSPGSMASAFGAGLAPSTIAAPSGQALPTSLAGISVKVRDSLGVERPAPLWFVSPTQINYYVSEETALGAATVKVVFGSVLLAFETIQVDAVSPALFSMNGTGQGVAAGVVVWVKADGSQTWQYVFQQPCTPANCVPLPLERAADIEAMYLILYGTGMRGRSTLDDAYARIGGVYAEVDYAGPAAGFVGLDQVNIWVPRRVMGRGLVNAAVSLDGKTSNAVTVYVK